MRWAAATPLVWKQTNRCGFRLERYTVVRDKKILDTPERKILGEGIFRPRPLEAWKDRIEENDNAAIVAQALYGEDFQLTGEDSGRQPGCENGDGGSFKRESLSYVT